MISEREQEAASLYVLGALSGAEKETFEVAVRAEPELRELVRSLERTTGLLAQALPLAVPPGELRDRIMRRVQGEASDLATFPTDSSFFFVAAGETAGWKQLPVPGAFIKLLSTDRQRGYAVLLGRLERGVRYPAHHHRAAEDIVVLTGDLTIAGRRLGPGDFHHCAAGTSHPVNYSDEGCTLLAVLALDHELVQFAMA